MRIVEITGRLKSDEITVTKSIGSLIFATNLQPNDILNEKISIFIERSNGNNEIIANKINLKDFIMSSTYGTENIQSDATYGTIALCELSQNGSILLAEKESIKIVLEDLRMANTYVLNGIEEPVNSEVVYQFEPKTIASEEFNKKIDCKGFDLAIMSTDASISDISLNYDNGQIVKYTPFELSVLSCDTDPVQYISNLGVVSQRIQGKLSLPLMGVNSIEVNKSQGAVINFVLRTTKDI